MRNTTSGRMSGKDYLAQTDNARKADGSGILASDISSHVAAESFAFRLIGAGERGVRWKRSLEANADGTFTWTNTKGVAIDDVPGSFVFAPLKGVSKVL